MISIVTGAAGFIGVNLVERLLQDGASVIAMDGFQGSSAANLDAFYGRDRFLFLQVDLADPTDCRRAFERARAFGAVDEVWHLAANSDIAAGGADPGIDLRNTFLTTFEVLGQMKRLGIGTLHFASSSAIYGDQNDAELYEDMGPLFPISNYGAMKLASEAQIAAAAEAFLRRALIFRFPNVVGAPATHGVILDFVRRLKAKRRRLEVLGDGAQRKPYLHVSELLEAMLLVRSVASERLGAYNIGPMDLGVEVGWIAKAVVAKISPQAQIAFGSGSRGWVGDVPKFRYSIAKIERLGWRPRLSSQAAVGRAIDEIAAQLEG